MPTKPILTLLGEKGSGKSITLRKVGTLLYGPKFNVMPLTGDRRDFDAAVTNNHFVAIDNADTKAPWLDDKLATVSTGGTIKMRKLYSSNTLLDLPVRCFLAITTRTPHFTRDDIADRLLIMKVARYQTFKGESQLMKRVVNRRDRLMNEVAHHLQEITVALRDNQKMKAPISFRMGDFTEFCMKIGRYAGIEDEVESIFMKMADEQELFSLEDNPLFNLFWDWVQDHPGQEVTGPDLCKELSQLAEENGTEFPYKGKKGAFCQILPRLLTTWKKYFKTQERKAGGRKKYYSLTLKEE